MTVAVPRPEQSERFGSEQLRAFRAGDAAAFAEVVRGLTPALRRMAMHYFQRPYDQEDAIQESLLLLYRNREAVDPLRTSEFPGFALTLSRRRMIDLLRERRVQPLPLELEPEHWLEERDVAEHAVAARELRETLERLEAKLKPKHRPFFRAYFVEGRELLEVQRALGLSAIKARYLRRVLFLRLREHRPLWEHLLRRPR